MAQTTNTETISLSIVEEQEIYREMYRYILPSKANIVISKISDYQSRAANWSIFPRSLSWQVFSKTQLQHD